MIQTDIMCVSLIHLLLLIPQKPDLVMILLGHCSGGWQDAAAFCFQIVECGRMYLLIRGEGLSLEDLQEVGGRLPWQGHILFENNLQMLSLITEKGNKAKNFNQIPT